MENESTNSAVANIPVDPLETAADYRAHGNGWEHSARKAGLTTNELRAKTRAEAGTWKKELREAEKNVIRETGCETIAILRNLMRLDDPKIQLAAAGIVMKFWGTNIRHKPKNLRKSDHPFDTVADEELFTDEMCYASSRMLVDRVEAKMTPEEKKKWDERLEREKNRPPCDPDAWKKQIPGHPEYRDPEIWGQFCDTNEGQYYRKFGPDGREMRVYVDDLNDGPPDFDPPPPREKDFDAPSHARIVKKKKPRTPKASRASLPTDAKSTHRTLPARNNSACPFPKPRHNDSMADVFRCDCGYETDQTTRGPEAPTGCPGCGRAYFTSSGSSGSNVQLLPPSLDGATRLFGPPVESSVAAEDATPEPHRMRLGGTRLRAIPRPNIPGYEILGELGRGGMGIVYKAKQTRLNRVVALKMILAGAHATEAERDRFRKEAEAVAALQHPGIVQIFEIGEHDGQPFLALEFVDGGSLSAKLTDREELMPAKQAAAVVQQLAEAVQYAHDQGVIHRDLKPANVLLGGDGSDRSATPNPGTSNPRLSNSSSVIFAKVTDFGLAKRIDDNLAAQGGTKTGAVMGTPSYISPEQASGKSNLITPLTDVYSLGAILYELLTGRPPFKADTAVETVLQVLNEDPVAPSKLRPKCPKDLETICLKCLSKSPEARYSSATKLAEDLGRFLRGEPILARPLSSIARGLKWARRHPAVTVFGITAIGAIFAVLVVLSLAYARVKDAGDDAEREAANARAQTAIAKAEKEAADLERTNSNKLRADSEAKTALLLKKDQLNERNVYALQLSKIFTVCERDPKRALELLDDPVHCPVPLRDFAWRYLRRLCERQMGVYDGHNQAILATAISPDGLIVATADRAGHIRLWSPTTRVSYGGLIGHLGPVNSIAFSPDGLTVATAGDDGTIRLFDLPPQLIGLIRETNRLMPQSGSLVPKLPGNVVFTSYRANTVLKAFGNRARCVTFSPDGRTLAAGGSERGGENADGLLRTWDLSGRLYPLSTGAAAGSAMAATVFANARGTENKSIRVLKIMGDVHLRPIISLAFSPNGQTLASGSEDSSVALSPVFGDAKPMLLDLHASAVFALAFAPNGKTLATVNNGADPHIRVWDLTERRPSFRIRHSGHTRAIYTVAFSSDGLSLATAGNDGTIRLWDFETGEERGRFAGSHQPIRALAFFPDHKSLVSVGNDTKARVWRTGMKLAETDPLESERPAALTAAAIAGNSRYLVSGDENGVTRVWEQTQPTRGPGQRPTGAVWKAVAAFEQGNGRSSPVVSVALSDSGRYGASAGADGLLVWDLNETVPGVFGSQMLKTRMIGPKRPVFAIALSADGLTLAAADSDGVWLWDVPTGKKLRETPLMPSAGVRDLTFAPNGDQPTSGKLLAVAAGRGVTVFDVVNNQEMKMETAHGSQLSRVVFARGGAALATGGDGGAVKVWDIVRTGEKWGLVLRCEMTGHADAVTDLAFSRDGQSLITGGQDRQLIIWDPVTSQERMTLTGHTDRIVKLAMTPNDTALLSIGRDGTVKRWKAE